MSGWILLSGGNEFSDIYAKADLAALEKRVNKTSPLLVVVTAPYPTQHLAYEAAKNHFAKIGIKTLMSPILSENDLTTENINQIANADAIYLAGGTPARLVKSFIDTDAETALKTALGRGCVVMGSSAGAMLMGCKVVMPGGNEIGRGLNFLPNQIVLPHFGSGFPEWTQRFHDQDLGLVGLAEGSSLLTSVPSAPSPMEFGPVKYLEINN
jgi:cyanophycinase